MSTETTEKYILKHKGVVKSYPFGKNLAVYSVKGEMFATVEDGKQPTRLSLRCDKLLASKLMERYEEVMPAYKLNKDKWIRIIISGQLNDKEVKGLIDHSYNLVSAEVS